jgi:hypothetical protein
LHIGSSTKRPHLVAALQKLAMHLVAEADFSPCKGLPLEALAMISRRKGSDTALAIMSSLPIPIAAKEKSLEEKSAKIKQVVARQFSVQAAFSYFGVRP